MKRSAVCVIGGGGVKEILRNVMGCILVAARRFTSANAEKLRAVVVAVLHAQAEAR